MTNRTDDRLARLERNARGFRPDPQLADAADLFHSDRPAWDRLPASIRSASAVYADMRDYYRRAVEAGVTPDDRGPTAA